MNLEVMYPSSANVIDYDVTQLIFHGALKYDDKGNLKVVFSESWWKENLLTEGGAYGHMAHPFDDKDLTFGDLKKNIQFQ